MLQFITNPNSQLSASAQALEALRGGCGWVELNMPNASFDELKGEIEKVREEAEKREAFLLITDHAEWAKELNVGGVHLTDGAVTPSRTRVLIGAAGVIGVDAYTYDDVEKVRNLDVDYVMLTPFKRGDKALGVSGVKDIVEKMRNNDLELPTVACGGVEYDDIESLFSVGVNGIAVSSEVEGEGGIEENIKRFVAKVDKR